MEHIKLEVAPPPPVYCTCKFGNQQRTLSHSGFRNFHGLSAADVKATPCFIYHVFSEANI